MAIRPSRTGNSQSGYTLVELLVVLTIVGLLMLAVPALLSAGLPGASSAAAARHMAADLRQARQTAILSGAETRFTLESGRYAIAPGGAVQLLPKGVSASLTGGGIIRFYPDGSSSGGTITVGRQKYRHRIVADWLTGRIALDE